MIVCKKLIFYEITRLQDYAMPVEFQFIDVRGEPIELSKVYEACEKFTKIVKDGDSAKVIYETVEWIAILHGGKTWLEAINDIAAKAAAATAAETSEGVYSFETDMALLISFLANKIGLRRFESWR